MIIGSAIGAPPGWQSNAVTEIFANGIEDRLRISSAVRLAERVVAE
jgi:hypothetical protein